MQQQAVGAVRLDFVEHRFREPRSWIGFAADARGIQMIDRLARDDLSKGRRAAMRSLHRRDAAIADMPPGRYLRRPSRCRACGTRSKRAADAGFRKSRYQTMMSGSIMA